MRNLAYVTPPPGPGRVKTGAWPRSSVYQSVAAATSSTRKMSVENPRRLTVRPPASSPAPSSGGTPGRPSRVGSRSEEHTSELQSRQYLVCRLLLEKKKQSQH